MSLFMAGKITSLYGVKDNKVVQLMMNMEKQLKDLRIQLINEICDEILLHPLPDITVISHNSVIVSARTIFGSKNAIFSPDYYIQDKQAEAVRYELEKAASLTDMATRLQVIADSGIVMYSGKFKLNEPTINVLKANELYQLKSA